MISGESNKRSIVYLFHCSQRLHLIRSITHQCLVAIYDTERTEIRPSNKSDRVENQTQISSRDKNPGSSGSGIRGLAVIYKQSHLSAGSAVKTEYTGSRSQVMHTRLQFIMHRYISYLKRKSMSDFFNWIVRL